MPDGILATKLFAPRPHARTVQRQRLVERLDDGLQPGRRLTLVSAPAGFGKTTVLGHWLATAAGPARDVRAAWVSLDAADNDQARLLLHVRAALDRAGLDTGPVDTGQAPAAVLAAVLAAVVNSAANSPGSTWVLMLDDYHVIESAEVHAALAFLLDHVPDNLHLVMATRADPPLPISRLRARGELVEVRAADLRFTRAETGQFLSRSTGLSLGSAEVSALDERTEGWIAGLQLAAISLRDLPDSGAAERFIAEFTGSNRFVIDYLADEVLRRQPAAVHDFLLRTCVLDRFTGALCDAVTEGSGGDRTLEELDRGNLFLIPLDDTRRWFRYHHLFADVLRARLLSRHPERVPELHRRASDWFASQGLPAEAVRHALAGEDHARAGHLVEEALGQVRRARQDTQLLAWIRALPDDVVRRSPVLSVVAAWSQLLAGDLDAAGSRLHDAEAALRAGAEHPELAGQWADTDDLRSAPATIEVYRASLAQAHGDVAGTAEHARRALGLAAPDDHVTRGAAQGFLGLTAWAAGDIPDALATFTAAARSLHAAGNVVDELDTTIPLADMWVAAGRPSRARRSYEEALRTASGAGAPFARAAADLHVGLAELDRELDDLDAAVQHLEIARTLAETGSITENRHRRFVAAALVESARGDHRAAVTLLDEAESLYRPGFYPDVRPIGAVRARIDLVAGHPSPAAEWAAERGIGLDDSPGYLREYEHLTLVRLLLTERRVPPALDLLVRLHAAAAAAARAGSLVEIGALQALAHHLGEDDDEAVAAFTRSITNAPEPENHVRLYLDEGPPMLALLDHVADRGDDLARQQARRILRRRADVQPTAYPAAYPAADALSEREAQVLRLLDSELTGPQIARELYVTINTLRTHTKRIFTKLDVTTRGAAVRRGRELGLL